MESYVSHFRTSREGSDYLDTLIELTLQIAAVYEQHPILHTLTRSSLRFFIESAAVDLNNQSLDPFVDTPFYEIIDNFIENEMDKLVEELIGEGELEVGQ